jgi:hypothetical protein
MWPKQSTSIFVVCASRYWRARFTHHCERICKQYRILQQKIRLKGIESVSRVGVVCILKDDGCSAIEMLNVSDSGLSYSDDQYPIETTRTPSPNPPRNSFSWMTQPRNPSSHNNSTLTTDPRKRLMSPLLAIQAKAPQPGNLRIYGFPALPPRSQTLDFEF